GKGLHFCSYITTSNRNYVLNHVSYHRLRCAVDGRVVAARGADHGAPAAPGPAGGRRRCRRVELTRARSHREEAALPPGHEFRQGAGRPGLHDRHPRARYSELQGVAQGHRGHRERPAVRLPAGVQGRRRVLHQDDGGQAQRPGRGARRARLRDERPQGREEVPRRGQVAHLRAGPQGRLAHGKVARELLRLRRLPGPDARPAAPVPKRVGHLLRRARPRRALQGLAEGLRLARGRCVT
ncbi:unnamed protein product, partial [Pelagomonas calceolata]